MRQLKYKMLTNCNLKWNTGYLVLDGNALTEAIPDNSPISIYVPGLIFNVRTGCLTLVFPGGHLKAKFVITHNPVDHGKNGTSIVRPRHFKISLLSGTYSQKIN